MRSLLIALAAASILAVAPPARAQAVPADGQVTRVDPATGRITLRHGPIKNLDMGAMTMVFRVKDPAMLQGLKVGDKIRFEAERVDGAITITKIAKAP